MFCKNCGCEIKDDATFCPMCGKAVENTSNETVNSEGYSYSYSQPKQSMNINDGVDNMVNSDSFIFRSIGLTLKTLFSKPIRLWGLSILAVIIRGFAAVLCSVPPILGTAVKDTIQAGMCNVFLDAYNGKQVDSKQIFSGFSSGRRFFYVAGGSLWKKLWTYLWSSVPIAGIVKKLSYSFTPYILMKKPEMSPLDALKYSMELTKGFKLKIYITKSIIVSIVFLVNVIFLGLSFIPYVGILFRVIFSLIFLITLFLAPLLGGVLEAAMFTEVVRLKKVTDIKLK